MSEVKYCQCGCGQEIVWKRHHKWYGSPKFIWGHDAKKLSNKLKNERKQLFKFCKCGCGEIIYYKYYKGNSIKKYNKEQFLSGHNGKYYKKIRDLQPKEKRYCKCGCGLEVKRNWIKKHYYQWRKGKTLKQQYGIKKSKQISKKMKNTLAQMKVNGQLNSGMKEIWTKEKIIKAYKSIPNIKKRAWCYYSKKGIVPDIRTVRCKFGELNNLVILSNKPFIHHDKKLNINIGYNEEKIIQIKEKELGIKFLRQYYVLGYWVDAYCPEKNIVLEVDENYHYLNGQLKEKDVKRQKIIEEKLGCEFIRVLAADYE